MQACLLLRCLRRRGKEKRKVGDTPTTPAGAVPLHPQKVSGREPQNPPPGAAVLNPARKTCPCKRQDPSTKESPHSL